MRWLAVPTISLLLAACAARPSAPQREAILPPGGETPRLYSPAVRAAGLVFLAGTVGLRPGTRELVGGGTAGETRQALENIRATLRGAGLGMGDLVQCDVLLADIRDYDAMNDVYASFFEGAPPARTTLGVSGLPLGARVEIACIAADR